MIRIEKLSKFYGTNQVLKNVNFNFEKGKVFGIVGENGSGKTTLFRCIAGLEKYSGQISSDFDKLKNHLGLLLTVPFSFLKLLVENTFGYFAMHEILIRVILTKEIYLTYH